MTVGDKPIRWLATEIKTPPLSHDARIRAGVLLRRLQRGERIPMPQSRPLPSVGSRCHELRIRDGDVDWRIVYRTDSDAILILEVFTKKSRGTPKRVLATCQRRMRDYDNG